MSGGTLQRVPAVWRLSSGTLVVQPLGRLQHSLQGSAAAVWLALDEPATPAELCRRVDEFGLDAATVTAAVQLLGEHHLVEAAG